ncbi:zinc ribbon domain-containing protein [Microbacterium galbinum]|uniref:zinc ribbon domain-containing protein n=1 Tax=Microbacterium galbinum TaxID=2851646 RepID=UPI001FFCF994|nr:zinc ribbon domain-containing protein [Microbacterium galbinum]MCK2031257.1 hypothetical protein [Microbacterium galbinum]
MPVYAHCDNCGHDFESWGLAFDESVDSTVNLGGNAETCPNCGHVARIMEGKYNLSPEGMEIVDAPQWSRDLIIRLSPKQRHRLSTTVQWAQTQASNPNADDARTARALEKSIEQNVPAVKPWLERFRSPESGNLAGWLSLLIAVITLIITVTSGGDGISGDELERILDETVRAVQSEQSPATLATPTPPEPTTQPPMPPPEVTELPTPDTH